jgi:hypothetical protein
VEKSSQPPQLEAVIAGIIDELQEMAVTPHVRELRAKAGTYQRVIANWAAYAPTTPQRQAMVECVAELHEKVALAKRSEVSQVSRRPTARSEAPAIPSVPPNGVAWSASVSSGSVRPQSKIPERVTTAPPPPRNTSIPPVSAARIIETPTPALLRSRRSR